MDDTSIFSFESLLRGFVPKDLTNTLARIHNKKGVSDIITESLSIAKQAFKVQIWAYRCEQVQEFEQSLNISNREKNLPSAPMTVRPANISSTSRTTPPIVNTTRWKAWISNALSTGRPWLGFHIYINSLIF